MVDLWSRLCTPEVLEAFGHGEMLERVEQPVRNTRPYPPPEHGSIQLVKKRGSVQSADVIAKLEKEAKENLVDPSAKPVGSSDETAPMDSPTGELALQARENFVDNPSEDKQSEQAEEAVEVPAEATLGEATDAVISGMSGKVKDSITPTVVTQPDPPKTSPPASAGAVEKTKEISAPGITIPGGDTGIPLTPESVLHHTLDQEPGDGALATCASFVQVLVESSGIHPQKIRKLSEDLDQALVSCNEPLTSVRRQCKTILFKGPDVMPTLKAKDN